MRWRGLARTKGSCLSIIAFFYPSKDRQADPAATPGPGVSSETQGFRPIGPVLPPLLNRLQPPITLRIVNHTRVLMPTPGGRMEIATAGAG
jgi:hypothetical protein